mgnify:CR=1 FL=1|jgi:hypothetical protein
MVNNSVNKWRNNRPAKFYQKAFDLLGKPNFVANVPHGMAYWKTKGLFSEHFLIDEEVYHCVPAKHHDYFYSTVKFYVPPNKLKDVLSISGSIRYDGLKKELTARCASIYANVATLFLGMSIVDGTLTIEDVKKKHMYAKHIRGEAQTYEHMRKRMNMMKRKNKEKYEKQIKAPFYGLAFKGC